MVAFLNPGERPRACDGASGAGAAASPPGAGLAPAGLDGGALARLVELDPTGRSRLVERVLEAFRASVARLRPQLEAARRGGDRPTIRLVAHTLKSSSASIGAPALSLVCARIEAALRVDAEPGVDLAPAVAYDPTIDLVEFDTALDATLRAIDHTLKARP
jgi:HPt (histidine-containing phosphotransfer) domain-containing protein